MRGVAITKIRLALSLVQPPVSKVWPVPTWARTLAWRRVTAGLLSEAPGEAAGLLYGAGWAVSGCALRRAVPSARRGSRSGLLCPGGARSLGAPPAAQNRL